MTNSPFNDTFIWLILLSISATFYTEFSSFKTFINSALWFIKNADGTSVRSFIEHVKAISLDNILIQYAAEETPQIFSRLKSLQSRGYDYRLFIILMVTLLSVQQTFFAKQASVLKERYCCCFYCYLPYSEFMISAP